ncbi:hypothetical protein I3843_04G038800 [Carya illinoinensis]|uniref:Uncharacterized protein n=1 Tax=Carya illinoinensis TaxID=32201 RepID=A0A922JQ59_CARIL|nr:hypothetical protein I3760_04G039300 [Carya illinoinensis]KAG6716273.1 hypothetical protein I3842_04G041300 [Carya illinoinensis]KAG7982194.1 hypothetical protein I3843_04G038800 [Carya illinoinensis]
MADFSTLLFDLDLVDLPLARGDFTWSNVRAWSSLDKFVVSSSWEAHFPTLCQKWLPQLCSHYFPLLLDCGGIHEGHRYFKFENMWLRWMGSLRKSACGGHLINSWALLALF